MKVLCSACEAAEASVLCCADDAALCARCDREVHAANRLASKHQRLPLLAPGAASTGDAAVSPPKCDICQECDAYFFCLEDRALLCRSCDVAVHTANAFVSAHRRFLLTGVQVGQEQDDDRSPEQPEPSPPPPAKRDPAPLYGDSDFSWAATEQNAAGVTGSLLDWSAVNEQFSSPAPRQAEAASSATTKRSPRAPAISTGQGRVAGGVMDWPLGEFFRGVSDFNGGFGFGFGFGESGTSKADSGKLGGSAAGSPYYQSSSEDRDADELFGQVPEIHSSVPELPSLPTASGLQWQQGASDSTAFVPDICSPDSFFRCYPAAAAAKRRRKC
ncbi:B-box zinc finger protein 22-like [Phragmites australis]|uniref:B-box zinc finger protein 22-like n=1 Tax=Phragmites australis TaxID=29695 RepID=UPI002D7826AD|nr:B-box zinc finger protein 22-like [Phragmites australis]